MMKIQIMNLHDLECIKPIISEFDDFWSVNILDQNFNNSNSIYFIAKAESSDDFTSQTSQESDSILGFIALLDTPIDIEISNIVVRKNFRNLGIGQKLLDQVFSYAIEIKKDLITLEVNEHNVNAIHLYEKNGFKEIHRRKAYYNNIDDAIFMQKEISA